jgi:NADH-quinone oxidoreductase subunit G
MACPGGCVGGAGQPFCTDALDVRRKRTKALYETDKTLQLHKSQDNHMVAGVYSQRLGDVGGPEAHKLLHTHYQSRRRLDGKGMDVLSEGNGQKLTVSVCVGTSCYVRGSHDLLRGLVEDIRGRGLEQAVDVKATFCFEKCNRGPTVCVGQTVIEKAKLEAVRAVLDKELAGCGSSCDTCAACKQHAEQNT